MADKDRSKELTEEEVEKANGEPLPDREAMSIIRGGADGVDFVGDVNAAISANVGEQSSTNRVSGRSRVTATSVGTDGEERRDESDEQNRPDS